MSNKPQPLEKIGLAGIRKRAQRAVSLNGERCSDCGSRNWLNRHHEDYSRPTDVILLCAKCHNHRHRQSGEIPKVELSNCQICGTQFQPKRTRRAKLCGSTNCLKLMGMLSAQKRWNPGVTSSAASEMESFHSRLRQQLSDLCGD